MNHRDFFQCATWSREQTSDKKLMKQAVKMSPYNIVHASNELKNDPDFVAYALLQNSDVFNYVSEELREDKGFILWLIDNHINTGFLKHCSPEIRNDKQIIYDALGDINNIATTILALGDDLKKEMEQIKWVNWTPDYAEYRKVLKEKINQEKNFKDAEIFHDSIKKKPAKKLIKL